MYTCDCCTVNECQKGTKDKLPKNCPMHFMEMYTEPMKEYEKEENREFYIKCSEIEALGYGQWVRLREIIEVSKNMGYEKLGLAFCYGLREEARIVGKILRKAGFQVISVICKNGSISKDTVGIQARVNPDKFEAMCNPIMQAELLNEQETEFNIALGLCVGHDSLFYKYSKAMVTTLVAKDRVLGHNPAAAIYCHDGYLAKQFKPTETK
ncbi:MAG: DUF1847 domain-containing protein [Lachnoclostridium edouardi]|uniref:DUF1847 domain-containing protein n=1 Tax=Lachnoclostridium edouardi TaxID=1926283 RepID=UPI0026DCF6F4|nr:DUF1847 domain-containing protein [Lachnoclostridium edouardi]MDO4279760.1 DUF1847 domain-containing protein [Lachnoclostridium edouardi]